MRNSSSVYLFSFLLSHFLCGVLVCMMLQSPLTFFMLLYLLLPPILFGIFLGVRRTNKKFIYFLWTVSLTCFLLFWLQPFLKNIVEITTASIISGVCALLLGIHALCFYFKGKSSPATVASTQFSNFISDDRITETASSIFGAALFTFLIPEVLLIFYMKGNSKTVASVIIFVMAYLIAMVCCYFSARYKTNELAKRKP